MLGFRREKSESNTPTSASSDKSTGSAPPRHLGEMLLYEGLIDQEQLNQALAEQEKEDTYLGQVLVNMNVITQDALTSFLVKQCKIPHLSLQDYDIGTDVLSLVPQEICEKYRLLPIDKLGRILTVAMVDPLHAEALDEVKKACPDLRIKPILCDWRHFEQVAEKVFQRNDGGKPVTMQSFGLSMSSAPVKKVEPVTPPAVSPTSETKSTSTVSNPVSGINAQELASALSQSLRETFGDTFHHDSKPDTTQGLTQEAMVQALRETMQDSMGELIRTLKTTPAEPVDSMGGITPNDLATLLRESIGSALYEPLTALAEEIRANKATPPTTTPSLSSEDIAHIIREGVGDTLQDAMATMVVQLRASTNNNNITAENIGNSIKESLNDTMQEVMAVFSAQMHAAQNSKSNAAPSIDPEQIASILKDSIREGMQDVQRMSQEAHKEQAASSDAFSVITPESLAEIMRDSVGGVMQEAMSILSTQLHTTQASNPASGTSFDPEQIAMILKESIREGMQEVLSTTTHLPTQESKQPQESSLNLTPELMSEIMRDSVGGAMQEAVAAMVVQMRAMMGKREQHEDSLAETREQLVSSLQAGMQDVVAATREAHMQQESRLAELAEATLLSAQQTSHLIETSVVAQNTQSDLYRGRRVRHASVTPFTIVQTKARIPETRKNLKKLTPRYEKHWSLNNRRYLLLLIPSCPALSIPSHSRSARQYPRIQAVTTIPFSCLEMLVLAKHT